MMLVTMDTPKPSKRYSLLTALTAMALAARIHGSDMAVMETGYRMLAGLEPTYQPVVLAIMNSPSAMNHMNQYVATLPPGILEMRVQKPVIPLISAG